MSGYTSLTEKLPVSSLRRGRKFPEFSSVAVRLPMKNRGMRLVVKYRCKIFAGNLPICITPRAGFNILQNLNVRKLFSLLLFKLIFAAPKIFVLQFMYKSNTHCVTRIHLFHMRELFTEIKTKHTEIQIDISEKVVFVIIAPHKYCYP